MTTPRKTPSGNINKKFIPSTPPIRKILTSHKIPFVNVT